MLATRLMEESKAATGTRTKSPRRTLWAIAFALLATSCGSSNGPYGRENTVSIATVRPQVWAVAPVINMSGQRSVDPLLQADNFYRQLQEIKGLTVIPVDRVVSVYAALGLIRVESVDQAALVCEQLGADALVVPTVTQWEPYNPPKMGASVQVFQRGSYVRPRDVDPRELVRQMAPAPNAQKPDSGQSGYFQSAGMFDAANGSVRESALQYAAGRADPVGPYGSHEIFVDSDKYAAFAYRRLTEAVLDQMYRQVLTPEQQRAATRPSQKAKILEGGPAGPQPFPSNRR